MGETKHEREVFERTKQVYQEQAHKGGRHLSPTQLHDEVKRVATETHRRIDQKKNQDRWKK